MSAAPSIHEQSQEVEIHYQALRNTYDLYCSKRPADWAERMQRRIDAAEAAYQTLRTVAERQQARMGGQG